jgi:hypothetical protein
MTTRVFIGLVTYPGSRYPEAAGPRGLATQLGDLLGTSDLAEFEVSLEICSQNLLTPSELPLDFQEIRASIDAELNVETDWRIYLNPGLSRWQLAWFMKARRLFRYLKFSPPWQRKNSESNPGAQMLIRLANIELAHLSLLKSAAKAEADWVLILEDDAWVESQSEFASEIATFIASDPDTSYVNLSESFSSRRLGIEGESSEIGSWGVSSKILETAKPVTNTVCAILYQGVFVKKLLLEFESIPMRPVIPIDWKLNQAIMNLYSKGFLEAKACWVVDPAPIVQGSMRSPHGSKVGE